MKKKIFITGAVREYDSANQKAFTDEIELFIKSNIVVGDSADNISVSVLECSSDEINIRFNFGIGEEVDNGFISREMYRCFTGEFHGFKAENSMWWTMGFGPDYQMRVFFPIEDVIDAHKKNTKFYNADRYKYLGMKETPLSLTVTFKF